MSFLFIGVINADLVLQSMTVGRSPEDKSVEGLFEEAAFYRNILRKNYNENDKIHR